MVFSTRSNNVFQNVFEFLSSSFQVITGLELHWMRHGSPGAKEAKKEYKLEIFTWSSVVGAPNEVEQPSAFSSSRYF